MKQNTYCYNPNNDRATRLTIYYITGTYSKPKAVYLYKGVGLTCLGLAQGNGVGTAK